MAVLQFLEEDTSRSLFPLHAPEVFMRAGELRLRTFINTSIFAQSSSASANFLSAPIGYALKDKWHVRKLLVLDPFSTFFLYDFVYRNSAAFQKTRVSARARYGYSFQGSDPLPPTPQYHDFRRRKYAIKSQYGYFAKVDIANCFNSLYHHKLTQWVEKSISVADSVQFGRWLREINSGESVNCFPQGIHPAKTIGNYYLLFIESSGELRSAAIIRFLDDVYLFSNTLAELEQDVIVLQQILGGHALYLNSAKTQFGSRQSDFDEHKLDSIKKRLLKKRERTASGGEEEEEEVELEDEESDYLQSLIKNPSIPEEDVELALSLLRKDGSLFSELAQLVFGTYPHLVKSLYRYLGDVATGGEVLGMLAKRLGQSSVSEFELFWITRMLIDRFPLTRGTAEHLMTAVTHASATSLVKAAVVEMDANEFGLEDVKTRLLRDSPGSIIGMSALAGLRSMPKSKRNYIAGYAANAGDLMHTLAEIIKAMP